MTAADDPRSDRVSLAGPDPLDVLRALLRVDPDAPPVEGEAERRSADTPPGDSEMS